MDNSLPCHSGLNCTSAGHVPSFLPAKVGLHLQMLGGSRPPQESGPKPSERRNLKVKNAPIDRSGRVKIVSPSDVHCGSLVPVAKLHEKQSQDYTLFMQY